jgi:dTDP-4-dehydrorhamnose reductase
MKLLVTGASGQVGWELVRSLMPLGEVVACDRTQCDLLRPDSLADVVANASPDVIVNAAAYTAVDKAESEEALAHIVNGAAVKALASAAQAAGALLVHYSTDYVFNGRKGAPYVEDDEPNPINAYGRSKLAGERAIRNSGCEYLIFRTSWVYAARGRNFLRTMLRLAGERDELDVVADQIGTPTWARKHCGCDRARHRTRGRRTHGKHAGLGRVPSDGVRLCLLARVRGDDPGHCREARAVAGGA